MLYSRAHVLHFNNSEFHLSSTYCCFSIVLQLLVLFLLLLFFYCWQFIGFSAIIKFFEIYLSLFVGAVEFNLSSKFFTVCLGLDLLH